MVATSPDPLFTMHHLGLSYRARPVLRAIQWQWLPGEHWAVLGPNGAGKTALARVLSGEEQHFSGSLDRGPMLTAGGVAYVCFERARTLCERDRKLDCSEFESSASDAGTRVRELVSGDADGAEIARVVQLLKLAPILDRGLRYVSTGEMRKALLANALLSEPALMILDSPLDGLDRAMQTQLGTALESIIPTSTATLVLCRNEADIPTACTHVLLLDRGRVISAGPRDAVLASEQCRRVMAEPRIALQAPAGVGSDSRTCGDAAEPTLALHDVSVSYGDHCVFRHLNWTLRADQHCLISGPNGCGKSTLLDLLTGDNHKAYGQDISLFGRRRGSGESVWDIKAHFGRVDARMQFAIPTGSSVLSTVVSGFYDSLGLFDTPTDRQRGAALAWLSALDLTPLRDEEFQALSFGLQRLVLLARAMVKEPAILLMDEATLSLDAGHRRLMLEALDHVIAVSDSQLLFVSHSAGDQPRCINQTLEFLPAEDGSQVLVRDLPAGASA